MRVELIEFSLTDGREYFDLMHEIGPGENGYVNGGYEISFEGFHEYLQKCINMSKGIDLKAQHVPQTNYWLVVDGKPVGIGKLRDHLNDNLKVAGGHIGYTITPTERGKGYGKLILSELLKKAKTKGMTKVLLTCAENNLASRKIIEANKGVLESPEGERCKYWIKISTDNVTDRRG